MKKNCILLCCMVFCIVFSRRVSAREIVPKEKSLEIIFVIDSSGSMKVNDPSKISLEMVQAFLDTAQAKTVRAGYVAYNHSILSHSPPRAVDDIQEREKLKGEISSIEYSGDTDLGLGVSYAYKLFSGEENTDKIMVLISDGETDLPEGAGRTVDQSNRELSRCVSRCREDGIRVYTVAFGEYQGNRDILENIAKETKAGSYPVKSPEDFMEVFRDIYQDNLHCRVQQFADGRYAGGSQSIRCVLDTHWQDEINILLLSPSGAVGGTTVQYGGREIVLEHLSHYGVGKIDGEMIDHSVRELTIDTDTVQDQTLQVYVISYRSLSPVLKIPSGARKNRELEYGVYLKDRTGNIVTDPDVYQGFSWELSREGQKTGLKAAGSEGTGDFVKISDAKITEKGLEGSIRFAGSGVYTLKGKLSDDFGDYLFSTRVEVENTAPAGSIPREVCRSTGRELVLCLDDYFWDKDGDKLFYTVSPGQEEKIDIRLEGNMLTLLPEDGREHFVSIQVSDGEDEIRYVCRIEAIPYWRAYWWAVLSGLAAAEVLIWILIRCRRERREPFKGEKNGFCGKLEAVFVLQPENENEIPPLSFLMNRVEEGRVSLGSLFGDYPKAAEALGLFDVFLYAGKNRNMILFHTSVSGVMVGSAIVCRKTRYPVSFGDRIYIVSPEGHYDLEIRYLEAAP